MHKIVGKLHINYSNIYIIFMIIFFLKAILYAVYIIPPYLFSAPDDHGHLSYIQYIYATHSIPILNQTGFEIDTYINFILNENNVVSSFTKDGIDSYNFDTSVNWIAQHPPLYYVIMAIFYFTASLFTNNIMDIVFFLRIITSIFGILSVYILHKILKELDTEQIIYYAVMTAFVFSAPLQYFFVTITNDGLTILLCLTATLFLVRYMNKLNSKDFYFYVLICSLIILTKYTGAVYVLPYTIFIVFLLIKNNSILNTIKVLLKSLLIAILLVFPYLIYNISEYGRLFPVYDSFTRNTNGSLLEYIIEKDYFEIVVRNIIMVIGWIKHISANNTLLLWILVFLICMIIPYIKRSMKQIVIIFIISYIVFFYILKVDLLQSLIITSFIILSCCLIMNSANKRELYFNIVNVISIIIVFIAFFSAQYKLYLAQGWVNGMNGRYYYIAVFPVLYIIFSGLKYINNKYTSFVPLLIVVCFIIMELGIMYKEVILW